MIPRKMRCTAHTLKGTVCKRSRKHGKLCKCHNKIENGIAYFQSCSSDDKGYCDVLAAFMIVCFLAYLDVFKDIGAINC